ncbi:MAG: molybdopterin-dependent oxidoreductase [Anaerolineaceae bacterium]|nr:molybdopterin-dependent oxidoreductase [Anaerolineaceae bacterium]
MLKSTKKFGWILLLVLPMLLSACNSIPDVDWTLKITGEVTNPLTLSYADLARMDFVNLDDVLMEKSRGEDEVRSFSGVDLATLLEEAGAPADYSTLTAIAADGYAIEISKDEAVNGIIAIQQGGEWITEADPDAGPIRLVFPTTPANRWVFQITEISVNP